MQTKLLEFDDYVPKLHQGNLESTYWFDYEQSASVVEIDSGKIMPFNSVSKLQSPAIEPICSVLAEAVILFFLKYS